MTTSPNPLKTIFAPSTSSPNNGTSKTLPFQKRSNHAIPKLKVTKPTTTAAGSNQNSKNRSIFFNLFSTNEQIPAPSPSQSSSSSSFSSMLFQSNPMFASVTGDSGSGVKVKNPKLKHSLFNRSKKHPDRISNQQSTGWTSRPWAAWAGGSSESREQSTLSLNLDGRNSSKTSINTKESTNSSRALITWIRPSKACKSDTEVNSSIEKSHDRFFKKKKRALAVNSRYHHDDDNDVEAIDERIMLHPHYNLSNPSVTSLSMHSSSHPKDQPWAIYQQHPYSLQDQAHYQQQQQQQLQHEYPHRKGVALAVHDIFGIGKVLEMILALFVAHDAFLFRRPIWMQCIVMVWEAIVVLLVIWGILRVVGLAEVVIWGADDLVRGTISTVKFIGNSVRMLIWR